MNFSRMNRFTSGSASKLLLLFTHFDEVKGDNLPNATAREQHVLASAENVLASIGEELGPFAERALRGRLKDACFFVGGIDKSLEVGTKMQKRTIGQLQALLVALDRIVERPPPVQSRPTYDRMNLVLAIKGAAEGLRRMVAPARPWVQDRHRKGTLEAHLGAQSAAQYTRVGRCKTL